jgi:hypothetical protein
MNLEVTEDQLSRIAAVARGAVATAVHMEPFSNMKTESPLEDRLKEQMLGGNQLLHEKNQANAADSPEQKIMQLHSLGMPLDIDRGPTRQPKRRFSQSSENLC